MLIKTIPVQKMPRFGEQNKNKSVSQHTAQFDGEALHNLAVIHHANGNLLLAEQIYTEAIESGYTNPSVFSNLGVICQNSGRPDEAISLYKKAIEVSPNYTDAFVNLGALYKNLDQLHEALNFTLKSLEFKPDNPAALINLGFIYKDLGQLDQALASTLKLLEFKPDSPDAYTNLGALYKDLGQLDQALASTLKSIELKPDNAVALLNLGSIYKDLGLLDQALVATLKSIELKPGNASALLNLGRIYKDLGQLDQALVATLKSIELKPGNAVALLNLGAIYKDLGQLDQALVATLKSFELNPDDATTLLNLGGIYTGLLQLDQALVCTTKSLDLNPNNPNTLMNLGQIYRELGKLDQALTSTLKSLELKPDNPDAHMNLAEMYEITNQKEKALKHYLLSAEFIYGYSKGSSITSMISSLQILIQLGRIKEAQEYIVIIPQILSKVLKSITCYDAINKKHDNAYFAYLNVLLPEIPLNSDTNISCSIHIGESHCLAFANQIISKDGVTSQIIPSQIKGAKAWHLGNHYINNYKTCFKNVIKSGLDHYKYILLSFGEIDCRHDEGILKHCSEHISRIESTSQATAKGYVRWIVSELSRHQQRIILLGTPAPQKIQNSKNSNSNTMNSLRLLVINSFNKALSAECLQLGIMFADVLKMTSDGDGFNHGNWMIDDVHLKPEAVQELFLHYLV